MRFSVILNRESGTLKTADIEQYRDHVRRSFENCGHALEIDIVSGRQFEPAVKRAAAIERIDGIITGGGDGTASTAAGHVWKSGKILGLIPSGTMNLYARSLGVPLDIWQAAPALAAGFEGKSDIATANGRPFLHQFSVGIHPRIVLSRSQRPSETRLGKIGTTILAALEAIKRPPVFPVDVECDGTTSRRVVSGLSISNNPYGEGHIPYADSVTQAKFGVYTSGAVSMGATAKVLADLILGSWSANQDIEESVADRVKLEFPMRNRFSRCVIDGELIQLERKVDFTMHASALRVLMPERGGTQT